MSSSDVGPSEVTNFGGRTGYVKAALDAGVPIVPSVSIGGPRKIVTQVLPPRVFGPPSARPFPLLRNDQ